VFVVDVVIVVVVVCSVVLLLFSCCCRREVWKFGNNKRGFRRGGEKKVKRGGKKGRGYIGAQTGILQQGISKWCRYNDGYSCNTTLELIRSSNSFHLP
jgi:hypothetical protein